MHGHAFISTPYGNFAVRRSTPSDVRGEMYAYTLTPLGSLDAPPLRYVDYFGRHVIDRDALEAEARRQLRARGAEPDRWIKPSPTFTINRVHYEGDLTVTRFESGGLLVRHHAGITRDSLTDSARAKLAEWWEAHEAEVLTPRFLAESDLEDARADDVAASRREREAREALAQCETESHAARERLESASAALDQLDVAEGAPWT